MTEGIKSFDSGIGVFCLDGLYELRTTDSESFSYSFCNDA